MHKVILEGDEAEDTSEDVHGEKEEAPKLEFHTLTISRIGHTFSARTVKDLGT